MAKLDASGCLATGMLRQGYQTLFWVWIAACMKVAPKVRSSSNFQA